MVVFMWQNFENVSLRSTSNKLDVSYKIVSSSLHSGYSGPFL